MARSEALQVTLADLRVRYVWCWYSQQLLAHVRDYCPNFPDVKPPNVTRLLRHPIHTPMDTDNYESVPGKKWTKCVCTVHTCFDNPIKLTYAAFALKRVRSTSVSHYAFWLEGLTLCGRIPTVVACVVKDPFQQGTCSQCIRGFLKRVNVYCD